MNVGALVDTSAGTTYCSGTLISQTVFLTAAHCGNEGDTVSVTFDSQYTSKSKLYTGTFHADAQLDLAVVVFDKPIRGITPAQLPTLWQLDDLPKDQHSSPSWAMACRSRSAGPVDRPLRHSTGASTRWPR
jgi:hypothetical protein